MFFKEKYPKKIKITPLIYSIIISKFSTVKFIIENLNADIFQPDELKMFYPIDFAKEGKNKEIIEFLEKKIQLSKNNYQSFLDSFDINIYFN